jgi:hypothetical protein
MPRPSDRRLAGAHDLPRTRAAHARSRAEAHAAPHARALAAALVALLACAGCSGGSDAAEAPAGGSAARVSAEIAELVEAYQPVDATATSDVHDRALERQRELLERLRKGDPALGKAALAAFRTHAKAPDTLRAALLEVAALCDPQGMAPVLEPMVTTYDPELGLGLRTRAAELLAATSPERAMALFETLLADERIVATLPPRETFVRGWAQAARASGRSDLRVLCDVAVDIAQPADARVAAVAELGAFGGRPAELALEAILFEAASDAYLRRKAAQALAQCLAPEQLCPLLERAVAHEHDLAFVRFVGDLAAAHCP